MYTMAARHGVASNVSNRRKGIGVQHSELIESFGTEDEHFFGSYEAERVKAEEQRIRELDIVETQRPTTEQLAYRNRFRRPVAWVMAAMSGLSLVALVQHGFQSSRRDVVAQMRDRAMVNALTSELLSMCREVSS